MKGMRLSAAAITLAAIIAGCDEPQQEAAPQPEQPEPRETASLSERRTPDAEPAAPSSKPKTAAPTPAPVDETTAAKIMASMGKAPSGDAPQLVFSDPKEMSMSDDTRLALHGFNLTGSKVYAKHSSGGEAVELQAQVNSDREIVVPAAQWHTLKKGSHVISVKNPRGQTAELPAPINVE